MGGRMIHANRMASRKENRKQVLTAEHVRSILFYESDTGLLRWKVHRGNGIKPGDVAGALGKRSKSSQSFIQLSIRDCNYKAHRIIWLIVTGELPDVDIDHIDQDPLNNRWNNLRLATRSQNNCNRSLSSRSSTGYRGVSISKGKFRARLTIGKREKHLGSFNTLREAIKSRRQGELQYYGEFAPKR